MKEAGSSKTRSSFASQLTGDSGSALVVLIEPKPRARWSARSATLLSNPIGGRLIERTGGFRKLRFARPSRREGRSGDIRVIYFLVAAKDRIYLVLAYSKSVKDNLTSAEENGLRALARVLEGED